LDESSAALDGDTASRITDAIHELKRREGGPTIISISHRLTGLEAYDAVAVVQAGRVAAMGPYADLMRDPTGPLANLLQGRDSKDQDPHHEGEGGEKGESAVVLDEAQ
jgi:ABC-type multidrug transport system fused ATPase/permease subunit